MHAISQANANLTLTASSKPDLIAKKPNIRVQLAGSNIDLLAVEKALANTYFCQRYRGVLYVDLPRGDLLIFDYGVLVFWGVGASKQSDVLKSVSRFTRDPDQLISLDALRYEVHSDQQFSVQEDLISLPNKEQLTLLAASHALAQSSKLEYFEKLANTTSLRLRPLSDMLALQGSIGIWRSTLSKDRGKWFATKSDIIRQLDLLDTPEFCSQFPELKSHYFNMTSYLGIGPRVERLNVVLGNTSELLDMLVSEQQHNYVALLQWFAIVLLAVFIGLYGFA